MELLKIVESILDEKYLESGRAPLYHSTKGENAIQILDNDFLEGMTGQTISDKNYNGISLTRDKNFLYGGTFLSPITFVLNGSKLNQKYKIIPFDYFRKSKHKGDPTRSQRTKEFEEFLIGDIDPLSKYLDAIRINISIDKLKSQYSDVLVSINNYKAEHPNIKVF